VFGHYKPDPETYLGVAGIFDLAPGDVMLVAAHKSDLKAAAGCGLRTAYIERPAEFGPVASRTASSPGRPGRTGMHGTSTTWPISWVPALKLQSALTLWRAPRHAPPPSANPHFRLHR
jgi:hypothetical protein